MSKKTPPDSVATEQIQDAATPPPETSPFAVPFAEPFAPATTSTTTGTVESAASTGAVSETHGSGRSDGVAPAPIDAAASSHGPRTRWAAIVWGLVFAALASGALYVVLSPQHRLELIEWVTGLQPTTLALYGALAIGVIVLLFGLVGLLRRAQRALAARRTSA